MTDIMTFLQTNYDTICVIAGGIIIVAYAGVSYYKLSLPAKKEKALDILLGLVIQAENNFNTPGAGAQKFELVYNTFKKRFPLLATVLTSEVVSSLIEEALRLMKKTIEEQKQNITD